MTGIRAGTWLRVLLVVSLGLNVAVLAGLGWRHFGHDGGHRGGHGPHAAMRGSLMPNPRVLRQVLPEDRRAVVDGLIAKHRDEIRGTVREVFAARRKVHALMTADTVDRAALDRAFAELRARDADAATAVQAMLTELATDLTPAERRAMAEAVERRGPRGRR
jgi:uncharacterized membrane protein